MEIDPGLIEKNIPWSNLAKNMATMLCVMLVNEDVNGRVLKFLCPTTFAEPEQQELVLFSAKKQPKYCWGILEQIQQMCIYWMRSRKL